jgi:hypothetical protein
VVVAKMLIWNRRVVQRMPLRESEPIIDLCRILVVGKQSVITGITETIDHVRVILGM